MALVNVVPTATHSTSLYTNDSQSVYGTESNIYDGDLNTYYGVACTASGGGHESNASYLDSQQTWATPITIQSVRAKMYSQNLSYGNYSNRGVNPLIEQHIYVRIGGSWISVYDYVIPNPGGDGAPNYAIPNDQTINGPWANVTGVRAYVGANSYSYEGSRTSYTYNYLYELQAFKIAYGDIGLRVKLGSGTVQRIGTDPLESTHVLRIMKNGTVYGIPLLTPGDVNASAVHINRNGTVYALPKAS